MRYLGILKSSECHYNLSSKVLTSKTINVTALYQYAVGNRSEMAKLMNGKDGGKNAMRLANTLLSVMSAASDNDLKKKDKMKVRKFIFICLLRLTYWFVLFAVHWRAVGLESIKLLSAIVFSNSYVSQCTPNLTRTSITQ